MNALTLGAALQKTGLKNPTIVIEVEGKLYKVGRGVSIKDGYGVLSLGEEISVKEVKEVKEPLEEKEEGPSALEGMTMKELKVLATEGGLPEEEWKSIKKKDDMITYLKSKA
jgi:hypothetical protein